MAENDTEAEPVRKNAPTELTALEKAAFGGVVNPSALMPEDEFQQLYQATDGPKPIEPPYNLRRLVRLTQENNTLSPCIEAMVTNVEGTGYEFVRRDGSELTEEDESRIAEIKAFFEEVWPKQSFITLRKQKRRDEESTGNAYIEVVRNAEGAIVFLRRQDPKTMRLVRLDDSTQVDVTVRRGAEDLTVKMPVRERRFVQKIGNQRPVYFKEFGASRDLDQTTGEWKDGVDVSKRASEIIHFRALPDSSTPYGIPRWIHQLPSVLGSRQAEEANLETFDHGGVPPAMVIVHGGVLTERASKAIKDHEADPKNSGRMLVLEAEPTGGSIDGGNNSVRLTVERFGSERTTDAMYGQYDASTEQRVRRAFRIPPIFMGAAQDYSFASAHVSYVVTEAQVFKPEREEFDEIITNTVLIDLGFEDYALVSKPLTIEDPTNKLAAVSAAATITDLDEESAIHEINEAAGTDLKIKEMTPEEIELKGLQHEATIAALKNPQPAIAPGPSAGVAPPSPGTIAKSELDGVQALATELVYALEYGETAAFNDALEKAQQLDPQQLDQLRKTMAVLAFSNPDVDIEGLGEIIGCTVALMGREVA